MKQELDIFIVAYQRPEILYHTLKGLYANLADSDKFNINLYIWINDNTEKDAEVCIWAFLYKPHFIKNIKFLPTEQNFGKAHALNTMYDNYSGPDHFVLVLDQDMYFKMPFMHIIEQATNMQFDILGFASRNFWMHIPEKKDSSKIEFVDFTIYYSMFIAGGMMLLPGSFLAENRWTNEDGVYGGDDAAMCLATNSKFVLEWDADWLDHDPLGPEIEHLQDYYAKKLVYVEQGQYTMPHGWYKTN